ncbi:MAG: LEA type 2 family protein [Paludibacteraceae bacterium]|nr:LEA type 2 family protein [Paludibacteraceae bacterium]
MRLLKTLLLVVATLALTGCASVKGLKNFAECKFNFNNVSDVSVASINVQRVKSFKDLSLSDAPKIVQAFTKKNVPLNLNVNVSVRNPNDQDARLDGLDYILWIDDIEMLTGTMNKQMNIGANQTGTLTLPFSMNLLDIFKKKTASSLFDFACGLATDNADASRVKVSIKPYFTVAKKVVKFPSYVTIGGDKLMPKKKQ